MVTLGDQLAGLATMSQAQLRAGWRRHHKGQRMPPGLGRDLAIRAIAWRLQERVHGGVSPATARELKRLIEAAARQWRPGIRQGRPVEDRHEAGAGVAW